MSWGPAIGSIELFSFTHLSNCPREQQTCVCICVYVCLCNVELCWFPNSDSLKVLKNKSSLFFVGLGSGYLPEGR